MDFKFETKNGQSFWVRANRAGTIVLAGALAYFIGAPVAIIYLLLARNCG